MTPVDVLREARRLLEGHWIQNRYVVRRPGQSTCYCLVGAVHTAAVRLADEYTAAASALCETLDSDKNWDTLTIWNDDPNRTEAEVLDLIDRAIERLKD